jgi:hypothetical protein
MCWGITGAIRAGSNPGGQCINITSSREVDFPAAFLLPPDLTPFYRK